MSNKKYYTKIIRKLRKDVKYFEQIILDFDTSFAGNNFESWQNFQYALNAILQIDQNIRFYEGKLTTERKKVKQVYEKLENDSNNSNSNTTNNKPSRMRFIVSKKDLEAAIERASNNDNKAKPKSSNNSGHITGITNSESNTEGRE